MKKDNSDILYRLAKVHQSAKKSNDIHRANLVAAVFIWFVLKKELFGEITMAAVFRKNEVEEVKNLETINLLSFMFSDCHFALCLTPVHGQEDPDSPKSIIIPSFFIKMEGMKALVENLEYEVRIKEARLDGGEKREKPEVLLVEAAWDYIDNNIAAMLGDGIDIKEFYLDDIFDPWAIKRAYKMSLYVDMVEEE